MRACFLVLALAAAAFAGGTQYGLHAGFMLPTGDAADAYKPSPMIGGQILFHLPMYAIEGSASYVFLSPENEVENFSGSVIPILAGVRTYTSMLFFGGGAALHMFSTSWDTPSGEVEESDSYFGAYGTVGTELPMGGSEIELNAKAQWIDFDEIWLSIQAGIYF